MPTSLLLAIATAAGAAAGVFLHPSAIAPANWLAALFALLAFVFAARGMIAFARLFVVLAFVPISALIAYPTRKHAPCTRR